jgi:hypothetical protein
MRRRVPSPHRIMQNKLEWVSRCSCSAGVCSQPTAAKTLWKASPASGELSEWLSDACPPVDFQFKRMVKIDLK